MKTAQTAQVNNLIENGWLRTLKLLNTVFHCVATFIHKYHLKKGSVKNLKCVLCSHKSNYMSMLKDKVMTFLFRAESQRIKTILPKKQISKYHEKNGVLYYEGRLSEETPVTQANLDFGLFFGNTLIF